MENDTWNGCMGQIMRMVQNILSLKQISNYMIDCYLILLQEIDLCASFVLTWESTEKHGLADFSYPLTFDYIGIIMPAPYMGSKALLLFAPFTSEVFYVVYNFYKFSLIKNFTEGMDMLDNQRIISNYSPLAILQTR